jgi:lysophospholipase L1-like esterase
VTTTTAPAEDPSFDAPPERGRPTRRPLAAGHVVVVMVVALVLGTLLNAQGLRRSAVIGEPGWQRDVSLALTRPLAWFSGVTLLDRPREALERAVGKDDDAGLQGGTAFAGDEPPPLPPPAGEEPRDRPVFTSRNPARLWIGGDSLIVTPGESIIRASESTGAVRSVAPVDGRIATGLARPDVFDWYQHIRRELRRHRPDVVVLGFGGNDDHKFVSGVPEGFITGSFGSSTWQAEYRRRVEAVMDLVARRARLLVWIGLPITSDGEQTRRFELINRIVHDAAADREGRVEFLDTYTLVAGDDGRYAEYLTDDRGALVRVRRDDGVHFERAGGDLIAAAVMEHLQEAFEFQR